MGNAKCIYVLFSHTPCGCRLKDKRISFDNGNAACVNNRGEFSLVCKRQERKYDKVRRRAECDPGYEITSHKECVEAALSLDGVLRNGHLVTGGEFSEASRHDLCCNSRLTINQRLLFDKIGMKYHVAAV